MTAILATRPRMARRFRLGAAAASAVGVLALSAALAPAASASPASTQSTHVSVNLSCRPGGFYTFNASYVDGPTYQTYAATYDTLEVQPGGTGGTWDQPMGNVWTGDTGIGSTNSISHQGPADLERVTVYVWINGIEGSASDDC